MNNRLKVIDHPDLVRDAESKAILNTNLSELDKYKQEREQRRKLNEIAQSYDQLKDDVDSIKNMLQQILGHMNK
jgi:hypothetical protein